MRNGTDGGNSFIEQSEHFTGKIKPVKCFLFMKIENQAIMPL